MKKYQGPPKPIPTHREIVPDSVMAVWFVVLAVLFLVIMFLTQGE
jgi:hypothetical protein